jgi:hypothetical protein
MIKEISCTSVPLASENQCSDRARENFFINYMSFLLVQISLHSTESKVIGMHLLSQLTSFMCDEDDYVSVIIKFSFKSRSGSSFYFSPSTLIQNCEYSLGYS